MIKKTRENLKNVDLVLFNDRKDFELSFFCCLKIADCVECMNYNFVWIFINLARANQKSRFRVF